MTAQPDENPYMIHHENAAEMSRLLDQDILFTRIMGGWLAERNNDFTGIRHVLDVGCGPGGWAQEIAFAHPEIEVVGIDLSRSMIDYARAQARVQHLSNVAFEVMDITRPLNLPDASFDLVNARLLGFLPPSDWPALIQEYVRITRPGGCIRLTETEMSVSNSPALEQEHAWFFQALWQAKQSFSANGQRMTITAQLAPLLRQAGCQNVNVRASALDWSQGARDHTAMCRDIMIWFKLMEPFYHSNQIATQEELDATYKQMLIEMQQDNFAALHYLLTASGEKPS